MSSKQEQKNRAQIEYEKHATRMRKLFIPEPIKTWDELPDSVKEVWKKNFPEIDKANKTL